MSSETSAETGLWGLRVGSILGLDLRTSLLMIGIRGEGGGFLTARVDPVLRARDNQTLD